MLVLRRLQMRPNGVRLTQFTPMRASSSSSAALRSLP
jgi:hypothetical protein